MHGELKKSQSDVIAPKTVLIFTWNVKCPPGAGNPKVLEANPSAPSTHGAVRAGREQERLLGREVGWPQGREGCGQGEFQEQNMSRDQEGNGYIDQSHVVAPSGSQDLTQEGVGEVLELWLEDRKNGWRNDVRE